MRHGPAAKPECAGCRDRDREIARLRRRIEQLERELERVRRDKKRQAAPFSKGPPQADPKRPGRKPGEHYGTKAHRPPPPPDPIDETYEAPLPHRCAHCGGAVQETAVESQYQVEIPRRPICRRFRVHVGHCCNCGRRIQGRHELQTSDALGAAASQLGPDAQAAAVFLNKRLGLSHGKVQRCFAELFGITLSPGGSAQIVLRAGRRCLPVYHTIAQAVRSSPQVTADETGWRIGGRSAWTHVLTCATATLYGVEHTRDGSFAQRILGIDYNGILIHDGAAMYDQFRDALHQQCLSHPMRRCLEQIATVCGRAVCFPRQVLELFGGALELRERYTVGEISEQGLWIMRGRLIAQLERIAEPRKTNPENERLAQHLWNHRTEWFLFLAFPNIDATNYRAEQALRYIVVNRKVWGGNRTPAGACAQQVLSSVLVTCEQQERRPIDYVSRTLREIRPPPLMGYDLPHRNLPLNCNGSPDGSTRAGT